MRIHQHLGERDERQRRKDLWLELNGDVEVLHDGVDAQRSAGCRPQDHHPGGYAVGGLASPVLPYLWDQLDAPEDGADGAEDCCGGGDGVLRGRVAHGEERVVGWLGGDNEEGAGVKKQGSLRGIVAFMSLRL